jgi:magnesium transporter
MSKRNKQPLRRKVGMPPGSLVYTGQVHYDTLANVYLYDAQKLRILEEHQLQEALNTNGKVWIDVLGLERVNAVDQICKMLTIHPLASEDILNTHQRTKLEEYPDGIFFVMHYLTWNQDLSDITTEQIALHWNDKYVATFQEIPDNTFAPIIERLTDPTKKLRQYGPDYLAYILIDFMIDSYFGVLDRLSDLLVDIQERIKPNHDISKIRMEISNIRRQMGTCKRSILPLRESIGKLYRGDMKYIDPDNQIYYRDLHDHVGQIMDYLESITEDINHCQDLYTSEVNQSLSQVSKLLTIISTIFIPLSFIASVYGMNFDHMPETKIKNGYFFVVGFMAILAIGMLIYFRRKRWF